MQLLRNHRLLTSPGKDLGLALKKDRSPNLNIYALLLLTFSEGYLKTVIKIILHLGRTRLPRLLPMSPKEALLIRRAKYG